MNRREQQELERVRFGGAEQSASLSGWSGAAEAAGLALHAERSALRIAEDPFPVRDRARYVRGCQLSAGYAWAAALACFLEA